MNAFISLLAVGALVLAAIFGAGSAGLTGLFAIVIPYLAIALFLFGFIYRILSWAKCPVPFRIPTTAGQQKSLAWIPANNLEAPHNSSGVIRRMLLEILLFRSLFRNTRAEMKAGPRLVYGADKWLWLAAIAFHYSFLMIFLRHLRFFTEPVPFFVAAIENVDGFLQMAVPTVYVSTAVVVLALGFLLLRRFFNAQVRYVSLAADYFPLFLLLGVAISGIIVRHFGKTDVVRIKELAMGLLSFSPRVPEDVGGQFYVHLFLVSALIAYFPFSKLMHLGGIFFSPTRNLANNNRAVRHVNPWNPEVKTHDFDHWAQEFKEEIAAAGYELKR
ncbi:MAG: sulfate reduction electron transfer complex DsrMKJOP subunit DsrM [Planctomycetota bacterium]